MTLFQHPWTLPGLFAHDCSYRHCETIADGERAVLETYPEARLNAQQSSPGIRYFYLGEELVGEVWQKLDGTVIAAIKEAL